MGVTTTIQALNGSFAAEHLGIVGSTTGATLAGEDRAMVAVDSVFSHLIALRDALQTDDERGISLATDRLDKDLLRAAEVRAKVGVRSRRVADASAREQEWAATSIRKKICDTESASLALVLAHSSCRMFIEMRRWDSTETTL